MFFKILVIFGEDNMYWTSLVHVHTLRDLSWSDNMIITGLRGAHSVSYPLCACSDNAHFLNRTGLSEAVRTFLAEVL